MDASTIIASLALIVSIVAVLISYKAYKHTVGAHDLETTLAFERDKSELLSYVEQSRNLFSGARREVELAQFVLGHEPLAVQQALTSYQGLFTDFLPKLVGAERNATGLWDEIFEWRDKSGRSAFAHHAPRFRASLENDRVAHEMALKCAAEFNSQMARAREAFCNGLLG
jgi:hypothetical protein